jgi:hypothetical protein
MATRKKQKVIEGILKRGSRRFGNSSGDRFGGM